MCRTPERLLLPLLALTGAALPLRCLAANALPSLGVGNVTVSGVSAGAFFATQFQVAHSSLVQGVGVLAGGPYYCAEGSAAKAEGRCMRYPEDIDVPALVAVTTATYETTRTIDDPSNLASTRVWALSATSDSVVASGVVEATAAYFSAFLTDPAAQLATVLTQPGEHAILTDHTGSPCDYLGEPFINNCDYDAAGALLQHLYRDALANPTDTDDAALEDGELLTFSQRSFLSAGYTLETAGLYESGFLFVPTQCAKDASSCSLHVFFHGCEQTVDDVGQQVAQTAGFNRWAVDNDLVVLYPQAQRTALNPNGCFDWWGYTGLDYASQLGVQVQAVRRMVGELSA